MRHIITHALKVEVTDIGAKSVSDLINFISEMKER
jgi:hypothetical protein